MRFPLFLVVLWALVILAVMSTSDAYAFLVDQVVEYQINLQPNFLELLKFSDVAFNDAFYLAQKTGHLLSFGILYILTFIWLKQTFYSWFLCTSFAFFSEVFQLFFDRNGRLFDVGIDLIGIFLAHQLIIRVLNFKNEFSKNG